MIMPHGIIVRNKNMHLNKQLAQCLKLRNSQKMPGVIIIGYYSPNIVT